MLRRVLLLVFIAVSMATILTACATASSLQEGGGVVAETFMVPSADPGIQLHVRNKRPSGVTRFAPNRVVLFVHGATYPAETAFDIDLPGGSWLDQAARRGFDAYLVDVRGYGRSTRPKAMSEPPGANPPFADVIDGVKDVSAAVDFIRQRRGVERINLVGWSWGTALMATYTAANNGKVERLALYAPLATMRDASTIAGVGSFRTVQREAARARSVKDIPPARVEEINPRAWFDKWFDANLATDPEGAAQTPPVVRAPNGVIQDIGKIWSKQLSYDPAHIRVPTLVVIGEWDQETPFYMAQEVFGKLTNTPEKRLVVLGEGTHMMVLEKNRTKLIQEVQRFLEE